MSPNRPSSADCESGAFDAERLLRLLTSTDPGLPVRLRRLHAAGDGPTASCGTAGELAAELRDARGTVAWRDVTGREWVALEVCVGEAAIEIRVRSDVGSFRPLPAAVRWE